MLRKEDYLLEEAEELASPALIYYRDIILENTARAIEIAGGAAHLWPHVKTHKMREMIRMQMDAGICRFKCATIAEAEMLADVGAAHILMAYPLVGPNIRRFITLMGAYPNLQFYACGDDEGQLALLGEAACAAGLELPVLLDVNMGMNRTGIAYDWAEELYAHAADIRGIRMCGLHCYDGNHIQKDIEVRRRHVDNAHLRIDGIIAAIKARGLQCELLITGGTPSFPCHAGYADWYYSPGTIFVFDWQYLSIAPKLDCKPGAAILSRVISHPAEGLFTLDVGSKAIAADPAGARGVIVGMEEIAAPILQSEEHWVFRMEAGRENERPHIGERCYIIPTHICPTTALYPAALVAEDGRITAEWEVAARNRELTY